MIHRARFRSKGLAILCGIAVTVNLVGGAGASSRQADVGAGTPAISTVVGRFFPNPTDSGPFTVRPSTPVSFTQSYSAILFNPPGDANVSCTPPLTSTVTPATRPMVDVLPQRDGSCATVVVAGNGYQAGVGPLFRFEAVFTASVTVAAAGDATFGLLADDGWILALGPDSVGRQPTYVGGSRFNAPATGPFTGYPVVGAYNDHEDVSRHTVIVHFPAAGTYPFELDYTERNGGNLALTFELKVPPQVQATAVAQVQATATAQVQAHATATMAARTTATTQAQATATTQAQATATTEARGEVTAIAQAQATATAAVQAHATAIVAAQATATTEARREVTAIAQAQASATTAPTQAHATALMAAQATATTEARGEVTAIAQAQATATAAAQAHATALMAQRQATTSPRTPTTTPAGSAATATAVAQTRTPKTGTGANPTTGPTSRAATPVSLRTVSRLPPQSHERPAFMLHLSGAPPSVVNGGTVFVRVQTVPHAYLQGTFRITAQQSVRVGTGVHRRVVTRDVVLYALPVQGQANARGMITLPLRIAYQPARPSLGHVTITSRVNRRLVTVVTPLVIRPLPLSVGISPQTVRPRGRLTVNVQTIPRTALRVVVQVAPARHGRPPYRVTVAGSADRHGRFTRTVQLINRPARPTPFQVVVAVRSGAAIVTGSAAGTLRP